MWKKWVVVACVKVKCGVILYFNVADSDKRQYRFSDCAVMAMYEGAPTVVRTPEGDSGALDVKVMTRFDTWWIIYIELLVMYR